MVMEIIDDMSCGINKFPLFNREYNNLIYEFYKLKSKNKKLENIFFNISKTKNIYVNGIYTIDILIPDAICAYNNHTLEDIKKFNFYLKIRNRQINKFIRVLKD